MLSPHAQAYTEGLNLQTAFKNLHPNWISEINAIYSQLLFSLQCFDAVGWAAGRASACKKLSGGILAWLSVWS